MPINIEALEIASQFSMDVIAFIGTILLSSILITGYSVLSITVIIHDRMYMLADPTTTQHAFAVMISLKQSLDTHTYHCNTL